MKSFNIGNKQIGEDAPVYIVFEAGQTFQSFENAKELIDAAAASGADAIKFQIYNTERLISSRDVMDLYGVLVNRKTGKMEMVTEPIIDSLKRHEMVPEQWFELKQHADSKNITFFATVCFPEEVDLLASFGVHVFKISSGDVNHHPLIRYIARHGVPVMLDTGSSTIGEVEQSVDIIREEGNEQIVIHHCPSGYPARLDSVNLNVITTLKQMFDYPIAFSDHTPGWDMDIAAVALGVDMVEKTITSDRTYRDAEHIMSVEVGDAMDFVQAIRNMEIALGSSRRTMGKEEWESKADKRRSVFAKFTLNPGDIITPTNIEYRRPGYGIAPIFVDSIMGKVVQVEVKEGAMIRWENLSSKRD